MHPLVICQNKLGFCISNVIVDVSEFACKVYNMELGFFLGLENWRVGNDSHLFVSVYNLQCTVQALNVEKVTYIYIYRHLM